MDDKYADLRAALDDGWVQSIHPDTVRALLADYDRMRDALTTIKEWPITSPLNMDAYNMQVVAHAALEQEGS
ncbi:hypothetical protein [Castellaniella sp. S9]|uniref:hypothetical protein n=1 Tax=Castellaniella sp. S9 TaxID=2993652 RepID=UPI0022B2D37A|nr:hypothetical protein [Castellaniella sp. S9]